MVAAPPPAAPSGAEAVDERALVERARARDQGAFRLLVDRHRNRAHGLALRIVRSAEDAEEVAQDAFVRAWLALPDFRGESSFSTWLYRIVARRAFDRLAILRRRAARETGVEAAIERAVEEPGLGAEAWLRARRLERLVSELNDAQRAVVALFYHEGRSVERVAESLGLPAGTVKTHLYRARAALREAWLRSDPAAGR